MVNNSFDIKKYAPGSLATIKATIKDPTESPAMLFDPTTVNLNIISPDGTIVLLLGGMVKVGVGEYIYLFQTDTNFPIGAWEISVVVVSGIAVFRTLPQIGFILE